ncbi:MAG: 50S ribosomal protein L4 [Patescibacteria group bacterium]
MKLPVYNQQGEKIGEEEFPKEIFEVPLNPDVVHQVVVSQQANRRVIRAHTKGRGEVSGGGRKPWPQKHTGRARHGSIRSPIWKGGGVTFGPRKERVYKKKINKKMRRKVLCMVLAEKARKNSLVVLQDLTLDKPKAKILAEILKKLPCKDQKSLIALPQMNTSIIQAARNLRGVQTVQAKDLSALDLLQTHYLVMPKSSIKVIEKTFIRSKD